MSTAVVERLHECAGPKDHIPEDQVPESRAPAKHRSPRQKRPARANERPSLRNRTIFERRALGGETLAALALEYKVTHQRIAQIAARVEGWLVAHPEDRLAQRMRLRCRLRYEALYEAAMRGFADSRREEVTVKERKMSRPAPDGEPGEAGEKKLVVTTVDERIVRQRHGDPRLLATALKAVEKLERFIAAVEAAPPTATDDARAADQEPPDWEEIDEDANDQNAGAEDAPEPLAAVTPPADVYDPSEGPTESDSENNLAATQDETDGATQPGAEPLVPARENRRQCGLPRIANRAGGPVVLMANRGHIEHMKSLAERELPGNPIIPLGGEAEARSWLLELDCEAALIWLEDNLCPSSGSGGPRGGSELARMLADRGADCSVVVGQAHSDSESPATRALREAGLKIEVVRRGEAGWIRRAWLPALQRLVA